jgi:FtsP/CotA-like multicopper oxidase with cupredoxin domain
MDPVTENPAVGATEIWEFYNTTADAHPMHVHEVVFQVVNRQGLLLDEDGEVVVPIQLEVHGKIEQAAYHRRAEEVEQRRARRPRCRRRPVADTDRPALARPHQLRSPWTGSTSTRASARSDRRRHAPDRAGGNTLQAVEATGGNEPCRHRRTSQALSLAQDSRAR